MSRPRGFALILNNIDFIGDPSARRDGGEIDSNNLFALLTQLHFEVTKLENVKKDDLLKPHTGHISKFLDQFKVKNVDCCIVVVMSHGSEGYFMTVDPEKHSNSDSNRVGIWNELLPLFNNRQCPQLVEKPKIFIIQACRGDFKDRGVTTCTDTIPPAGLYIFDWGFYFGVIEILFTCFINLARVDVSIFINI